MFSYLPNYASSTLLSVICATLLDSCLFFVSFIFTMVSHLPRLCCIYHDCVAFITTVLHLSRLCFPLCFYSFLHSRFIWWWFDLVWSTFWPLIIRSIPQAIYLAINILVFDPTINTSVVPTNNTNGRLIPRSISLAVDPSINTTVVPTNNTVASIVDFHN